MTKNLRKKVLNDYVAKDINNNKICVSGSKDNFTAIKNNGKWEKGYPEFDDLMDNFFEEKYLTKIQAISSEARRLLNKSSNINGKKNHQRFNKNKKRNSL